jgi:hypothetical protein
MLLNRRTMAVLMLIAATVCLSPATAADGNNVFRSKAKYMKYVGTYYTDNGQTVTINSDGTETTVLARMFSNTEPVDGSRTTIAQGVWREVGNNEIQITNIRFITLPDQSYATGGLIQKSTFVGLFDKPVQGQSLGFTVDGFSLEYFTSDQNPITDEPIAAAALPGSYRAYRLETKQPGS